MPVRTLSLSYPIDINTPIYGNLPKPKIIPYRSLAGGDACNIYIGTICNHTGTHVDTPAHFKLNGRPISDYSLEELTFRKPILIDVPKGLGRWVEEEDIKKAGRLGASDCLLIRTGFGALRDKDVYRTHNPGVSPEAILWLRQKFRKIRCIGIDSISISGFQDRPRGRKAHLAAFEKRKNSGEPLLLVEDMNLAVLKANEKLRKLIIVPWPISNMDSAPCTVLAEVKNYG